MWFVLALSVISLFYYVLFRLQRLLLQLRNLVFQLLNLTVIDLGVLLAICYYFLFKSGNFCLEDLFAIKSLSVLLFHLVEHAFWHFKLHRILIAQILHTWNFQLELLLSLDVLLHLLRLIALYFFELQLELVQLLFFFRLRRFLTFQKFLNISLVFTCSWLYLRTKGLYFFLSSVLLFSQSLQLLLLGVRFALNRFPLLFELLHFLLKSLFVFYCWCLLSFNFEKFAAKLY